METIWSSVKKDIKSVIDEKAFFMAKTIKISWLR